MVDNDKSKWIAAADQDKNCWDWEEVYISEATSRIQSGTRAFRRKRTQDGEVSKFKARYFVRGDRQEGNFDTYAPVVVWATDWLFLALSLILDWKTVSIDFASAFVQATLKQSVWIHLS
jgi:hypothetical protein